MLARRTTLGHNSTVVDMPRLIPSFSSKGFPFFEDKENNQVFSEVTEALELTGPIISDSILISAYDISHNYLRNPERFYGNKELVFIDSGGYELSTEYDSTDPKQEPYQADKSYSVEDYQNVLSKLSIKHPIVITNFDHVSYGREIKEQILDTQKFFNNYKEFFHCFIIRPSKKKTYLDIDDVLRHIEKMRRFDIIGVTEKELGNNLLDRLVSIANLRIGMDRKSLHAPIHVWGGLDPVISLLYFCAGAEIFDGVSWLRYGYHADMAISRDAYTAIVSGVQAKWRRAEPMRLVNNISYLEDLTIRMRRFVDGGGDNFSIFGNQAEIIERGYQALCTKIPELKGGA